MAGTSGEVNKHCEHKAGSYRIFICILFCLIILLKIPINFNSQLGVLKERKKTIKIILVFHLKYLNFKTK